VLWLLIAAVAVLVVPPVGHRLLADWEALTQAHEAIVSAEAHLADLRLQANAARQTRATLVATQAEAGRLQAVAETIRARQTAWAPLLTAARALAGPDITVTALAGAAGRLDIEGHAPTSEAVLAYAQRLRNSGIIANASVASFGTAEAPPDRRAFRLTTTLASPTRP
jgi:hypothetical protein